MMLRILIILGALQFSLAGCALIHHDTPPMAMIEPSHVQLAADIHLMRENWPAARWWRVYGDPNLDALIDRALSESPTIAVARSRLAQARANVDVSRSSTDLQVALFGSVDRQHVSDNGFLSAYASHDPEIGADGPSYTEGVVGLGGRLDIDLWGKQRADVAASIGAQNAQRADEAAAELELAADVAQLYFSIQVTYAKITFLNESLDLVEFTAAAHEAREQRGLEGDEPNQQARAQVLAIQRELAAAAKQVILAREALRALTAIGPGDLSIAEVSLPDTGSVLPRTLSYELLARRPDLQALRWTVEASFDRVDAAKASFYPSFDITAFFGFNALRMSDLFTHSSQQINVIPGLTLPLFDGGRLNASLQSVRSASNVLIAQYNQAVLNAVRDVAQTGANLQDLERESNLQAQRVNAVRFSEDRAQSLYERGLADAVTVREATQPVIAEQMVLLQLHGQQIDQQIALIRTLGGGYQASGPGLPTTR